jgi:hypothetical protein
MDGGAVDGEQFGDGVIAGTVQRDLVRFLGAGELECFPPRSLLLALAIFMPSRVRTRIKFVDRFDARGDGGREVHGALVRVSGPQWLSRIGSGTAVSTTVMYENAFEEAA